MERLKAQIIYLNPNIANFPVFICLFFESQRSFFAVFAYKPCSNIPGTQQLFDTNLSQLKRDNCTIGYLRNRTDIPSLSSMGKPATDLPTRKDKYDA